VSTVKLKKKWKEESQDWDKNGDPAADSSLDIDIESKALHEVVWVKSKNQLYLVAYSGRT